LRVNEGTDLVQSSVTYTLAANIENLTLTGNTAINATGNNLDNVITGNSGANQLTGGAGNDRLDGAAGNDTMIGGLGDDIYVVQAAGDVVTENVGEGIDTIESSITISSLASNVENLTLTGVSAIDGTGNTLDNVITGNSAANTLTGGAGNDTLVGGAGADTMIGGAGDDIYVVDNSGDVVTEATDEGGDLVQSSISHTLLANVENLTLAGSGSINGTGNSLDNILTGNSGNNILHGAGGNDTLIGGGGYDSYQFGTTMGQSLVNNLASDGNSSASGEIDFLSGVSYDQLWFMQTGNDLQVDLLGTTNHVTISGWYGGSDRAQVQSFNTADGLKLDSQIAQLVAAMATYSTNNPGFDPTQATQMPTDSGLQSTLSTAWHQ
jgi:Ca2+-binding RTX toxin-like protein